MGETIHLVFLKLIDEYFNNSKGEYTVETLINHILCIAHKNNRNITQLQLQKVAYFSFGYLIEKGYEDLAKKLYKKEQFEAWMYGPVLAEEYKKYRKYRNLPILEKGETDEELDKVEGLNSIVDILIQKDVFDLVNVSHSHTFWQTNKTRILNNEKPLYSFDTLRREFNEQL